MLRLIAWLRCWIGVLRLPGERDAGAFARLLRAALLVPPFGVVLVALHACRLLGRPVVVDGEVPGGRLQCRLPDLISLYIALFDTWEPDLSLLIGERLRPGDVFVDVGANIGYYALLASQCVGDDGRVVAVEASPGIHDRLRAHVDGNTLRNVRIVHAAASDHGGHIEIYSGPSHNLGLTTTVPGTRRGLHREATVPAAPLSELLDADEVRRMRLLKVDVEGGEPAVLRGMADMLPFLRPDAELLIELSPAWWDAGEASPEELIAPLRAAGFHSYVMDNSYWPWRYLWPNRVRRPQRVDALSSRRVKRIDLVLSRVDAPHL